MIAIKRVYVENYKLFSEKELDFSTALLTVFDGPNGYGKTSIFDAIELLTTGRISRVLECESIDGKLAYQTIFFAKNSDKDVILKAEFEVEEANRYIVLGAKVKADVVNGKSANPKNIFDNIEFYNLPAYDISIDSWTDYLKSSEEMKEIRSREFGQQNIEQFTLFHYIRQEDRLAYFKQSETSRASTIEDLLGVAKESEKYKSIQGKRKIVDKIYKEITDKIKTKRKYVIEYGSDTTNTTEYEPLIDGLQVWDKESVPFGNSNQDKVLSQYITELEKLEFYAKYADSHSKFLAYEEFMKIPEEMRGNTIRALTLLQKTSLSVEDIEISFQNLSFLKKQLNIIESQEYKSIDIPKIYKIIEMPEDKILVDEISTLGDIQEKQGELQKAINNVIQMRDKLHISNSQISENGICPYCGHDWENHEELERQFMSTKTIMQRLLTQDGELYAKQLEIIKLRIDKTVLEAINNKIAELSNNDIILIYSEFNSKAKFISSIENAHPLFDISSAILANKGVNIKNDSEYLSKIMEMCLDIGNMIPAEYLRANEKYVFSEIRRKYTLHDEIIARLQKEQFDKKRQYLQEQFYKSFDKIREEINDLEKKRDTIEVIRMQLKEYEAAVKNAIETYKKQIIDEIEIPFFVYFSRLLQSYQGGQGVLMKNDGGSIRFTSPGKEHDVLYTMSSGQLSAVLLSFSLALNKIYSGHGIKTLLIDDPIQCMDDIIDIPIIS